MYLELYVYSLVVVDRNLKMDLVCRDSLQPPFQDVPMCDVTELICGKILEEQ